VSDWRARLHDAIRSGTPLVVGDALPTERDPATYIPAPTLADALHTAGTRHPRGLTLVGAWVGGRLDLDHLQFALPLTLQRCRLEVGVTARNIHVESVTLDSCWLGRPHGTIESLDLRLGRVDNELTLRQCHLDGQLDISECVVGHSIRLSDVDIDEKGTSIFADGLTTTGSLFVRGKDTALAGGIRLRGAKVGGQLNLLHGAHIGATTDGHSLDADRLTTTGGLFVDGEGTALDGGIRLLGATLGGQLNLQRGAHIGATTTGYSLNADNLTTTGDLFVHGEGTALDGGIRLVGARVGGVLVVQDRAHIGATTDRRSLDADRLTTTGGLYVQGEGTALDGGIRLVGATLGGQLNLQHGAHIGATTDGHSLDADRLTTTSSLFVHGEGTTLHGGIRLTGAKVGGQLNLQHGAHIGASTDGHSLDADGLTTTGGLFVQGDGTILDGGIHLRRARVHGGVYVRSVTMGSSTDGWSLVLDDGSARELAVSARVEAGMSVRRFDAAERVALSGDVNRSQRRIGLAADDLVAPELDLREIGCPGGIDLTSARIGRVRLPPSEGSTETWWSIDGIQIAQPIEDDGWTIDAVAHWLSCTGRKGDRPATRGTYRDLAAAYRRAGHDDQATELLVRMRRTHDSRLQRFALAPIRQGYAPQRAIYYLAALFALTATLVWVGSVQGRFIASQDIGQYEKPSATYPLRSDECSWRTYPCLRPVNYALETIVPVIDLGTRTFWVPATTNRAPGWSDALAWYLTVARLVAWVLGGLFVIGALRVVLEERRQE
jgi:hypothetical protein